MPAPLLSVIVPAHQASTVLRQSLGALEASTLARASWELVVVDDASSDDTSLVAAEFADTVVRLGGRPHGPAYARNRGFELTRGDLLVFVDADVCVHADTLARFAQLFEQHPDIGAALGSYDVNPPANGFISQYRNLLHHYHHQRNPGDAETFWAGCGAVRANVFVDADMYDEWAYPRPQIEDVELGHRIRAAGHRIVIRPEIQCAHLKRWTFRGMVKTDLHDRGVPWARLLVAQGAMVSSDTLNLKRAEKVSTALAWLMVGLIVVGVVAGSRSALVAGIACLIPVIYVNRSLYGFFERVRGFWFALRVVPMHVLYYLLNGIAAGSGWFLHHLVGGSGPEPVAEAVFELGLKTWPPAPVKRRNVIGARVERETLPLAFAPLHKGALGVAVGVAAGLTLALFTLIGVVRGAPRDSPLVLLDEYFAGYSISLMGVLIGFLWAFGTGMVAGWFIAFSRNFVLAASIFWIRARADLSANRDFLDHI